MYSEAPLGVVDESSLVGQPLHWRKKGLVNCFIAT